MFEKGNNFRTVPIRRFKGLGLMNWMTYICHTDYSPESYRVRIIQIAILSKMP